MVDDQEQVLLELSFPEITKAASEKSSRPFMQNFTLTTVCDERFVFQSPNSGDICELVNFFIDGLKTRSKFVIGTQDYKADNSTALSFAQGDLMILEVNLTGGHVGKQSWVQVKLDHTGEKGDVPTEYLYVLPTTNKPTSSMLAIFNDSNFEQQEAARTLYSQVNSFNTYEKPHTLEDYSIDHFRPPPKHTFQRTLTFTSPRKRSQ